MGEVKESPKDISTEMGSVTNSSVLAELLKIENEPNQTGPWALHLTPAESKLGIRKAEAIVCLDGP